MWCILAQVFGAGEIAVYYCATLVYKNQTAQEQFQKRYGNEVMSDIVVDVSTWAFRGPETFLDNTKKERSVWIVQALFCCIRFTNNSGYLPGDDSTEIQRCTKPYQNIVLFV